MQVQNLKESYKKHKCQKMQYKLIDFKVQLRVKFRQVEKMEFKITTLQIQEQRH